LLARRGSGRSSAVVGAAIELERGGQGLAELVALLTAVAAASSVPE